MSKKLTEKEATLEAIAIKILDIPTLESRGRDGLDFHDLGVGTVKRALDEAYKQGQVAQMKDAIKNIDRILGN